jgi:hypothetical protein
MTSLAAIPMADLVYFVQNSVRDHIDFTEGTDTREVMNMISLQNAHFTPKQDD